MTVPLAHNAAAASSGADGVGDPDPRPLARLRETLGARAALPPPTTVAGRPAAVLVPLIVRPAAPTLLLIRRAAHLREHAGQIGFPGGRAEAGDEGPEATALREAWEEVGLEAAGVQTIGRLDAVSTQSGFAVVPVVGLVAPTVRLRLAADEVAEAFEMPLGVALDAARYGERRWTEAGKPRTSPQLVWQDRLIWGATARMLRQLCELLRG